MNSTNSSYTMSPEAQAAAIETIIQDAQDVYVLNLSLIAGLTLVFYTTILKIEQEIEDIWGRRFALPSFLYVSTRYGVIISQVLFTLINLFPRTPRSCDNFADAGNSFAVLSRTVGVQGLLIARTYYLCQGNIIVAGFLAFGFVSALTFNLFGIIAFGGCFSQYTHEAALITLLATITTVALDFFEFGICLWNVWGTWKEKRAVGIQKSNDLVSILLKQIVSRFCFVIAITITVSILDIVFVNSLQIDILFSLQNILSAVLVADFTLDLRQRNSTSVEVRTISFPAPQFRSVLRHIHESLLVEMGDHFDENTTSTAEDVEELDLQVAGELEANQSVLETGGSDQPDEASA